MNIYRLCRISRTALQLIFALVCAVEIVTAAEDEFAAGVFRQHCATCHEAANIPRVPTVATLRQMSNRAILRALDSGSMREQGLKLGRSERSAVANWLGTKVAVVAAADALANRCKDVAAGTKAKPGSWGFWGGDLQNSRFQSAAAAGISSEDVPKLKLKWAFGFPDFVVVLLA